MNKRDRPISNLGGYIVDRIRLSRGLPINLHGYFKFIVLRELGRRTRAKCLVESGTFLGVTSARCARAFDRVFTIELDPQLANDAKAYLRRYPNVEVYQGDAVEWLPKILARPDAADAVIWLDGHYSGDGTAQADVPEPALVELERMAPFRERVCGIVIDDFRLFGTERGFPTKSALVSTIETLFPYPTFDLKAHADQLIVERRPSSP
jgi:hypothetical protein